LSRPRSDTGLALYQNSQTLTHAARRPKRTIAKTYGGAMEYRRSVNNASARTTSARLPLANASVISTARCRSLGPTWGMPSQKSRSSHRKLSPKRMLLHQPKYVTSAICGGGCRHEEGIENQLSIRSPRRRWRAALAARSGRAPWRS